MARLRSLRRRDSARRAVVHHTYRSRRRQSASTRNGQHIAHADVLPLRRIVSYVIKGGFGNALARMVLSLRNRSLPPRHAEQQHNQSVCQPFRHSTKINYAHTNAITSVLLSPPQQIKRSAF